MSPKVSSRKLQSLGRSGSSFLLFSLPILFFIFIIFLVSIFLPWYQQDMGQRFLAPSLRHWMGTDALGRDVFARLVHGSMISLSLGVLATVVSFIFGFLLGGLAGWRGGWVGEVFLSVVDVFLAIPQLVFLILTKLALDLVLLDFSPNHRALLGILLGLGLLGWMVVARMVFFEVQLVKRQTFMAAGKALGKPSLSLLLEDVCPNIISALAVLFAFRISGNILYESFLSFIGLGVQAPYGSWGSLIADGLQHMQTAPHLALFPGLGLMLTLFCLQVWADKLQFHWGPKHHLGSLQDYGNRQMVRDPKRAPAAL